MDPLTVPSAVALLVLTKAIEKTGDKLGERVVQAANQLWQSLQKKQPETAGEIIKVARNSDLSQPNAIEELQASKIVSDIQQLADEDKDFRSTLETAVQQWQMQSGGINNSAKIADKIGVLNQGSVLNQVINQTF